MQGSFSLPQRLSLQSLAAIQSHGTFSLRSVGFHSVSHWHARELDEPGRNNSSVLIIRQGRTSGPTNDFPIEEPVTWWGSASLEYRGYTRMRGYSSATISSWPYRTVVISAALNRAVAVPGKLCSSLQISSFGIPRSVQRHTVLRWISIESQRGYTKKPFVQVDNKKGGQDLLMKKEEVDFKRIVSEDDFITTFYSSDISFASEDEEVVKGKERRAKKEKKTNAGEARTEDSYTGSVNDEEQGMDYKQPKKVKALRETQDSEDEKGVRKYQLKSDAESEDENEEQKKELFNDMKMQKGERFGKSESSDTENADREEKKLTKDEKKKVKADLKLEEKLDKDNLKTIKKDEKKQKKEAKKLKASKKQEEVKKTKQSKKEEKVLTAVQKDDGQSDGDGEDNEEHMQYLKVKTKGKTKLRAKDELASVSEYEEEDDGVATFVADTVEKDEEEFNITDDETSAIEIENELAEEIGEELEDLNEDDGFWDEDEEGDVVVGDGGDGGGVLLGGAEWGKKALDLAQQVLAESGNDLSLFAFKVSPDGVIRVRLDKLSDRYGSPTMSDIERFSRRFSSALEESGELGTLPKDVDVEVSSPGAERVVRVPEDLERFKELPMYVQYVEGEKGPRKGGDQDLAEKDGVLELESLDIDTGLSVWKIANVQLNREVKGKGRPLNSKQKKWRAEVPLASLKQVRLYLDV